MPLFSVKRTVYRKPQIIYKLLDLRDFGKIAGYNRNIPKSIIHIHVSNYSYIYVSEDKRNLRKDIKAT